MEFQKSMKVETKDKIKNGLTYLLIAIVYVTYTLNVSFMISSWVLPTTEVVPFWSMEELIVWIALMGIFTTISVFTCKAHDYG